MANFKSPLLTRRLLLAVAVLVTALLAVPSEAPAEIILDDFDDAVVIDLPEMENEDFFTNDVGELSVVRRLSVFASQTDPFGLVDADVTRQSYLTGRIDGQSLNNPLNTPLLSFGASYDFAIPVDLTEGGLNQAVSLDMGVFQGPGLPGELSVVVVNDTGAFAAIVPRVGLLSDSPYTLTLPFSSFGPRGGVPRSADFSKVRLLGFTVRLLIGNRDPDTRWLVQINRFRVARVVPEPEMGGLAVLAMLGLAVIAARRQRGKPS